MSISTLDMDVDIPASSVEIPSLDLDSSWSSPTPDELPIAKKLKLVTLSSKTRRLFPVSAARDASKYRQLVRTTARLKANADIPDQFRHQFEPLKEPPSYKSVMKIVKSDQNYEQFWKTKEEADEWAKEVAQSQAEYYQLPVDDHEGCSGTSQMSEDKSDDGFGSVADETTLSKKSILRAGISEGGTARRSVSFNEDDWFDFI